jgi:voltage-gated potassium channel Kch
MRLYLRMHTEPKGIIVLSSQEGDRTGGLRRAHNERLELVLRVHTDDIVAAANVLLVCAHEHHLAITDGRKRDRTRRTDEDVRDRRLTGLGMEVRLHLGALVHLVQPAPHTQTHAVRVFIVRKRCGEERTRGSGSWRP